MQLTFVAPTGADMQGYMELGRQCAAGKGCWAAYRPVGFTLYASLPYRMGWQPEAVIGMNLLFMAVSVILAGLCWNVLVPALKSRNALFSLFKYALIGLAHWVFMGGAAREVLSDVPAACAGLVSIWLFILAGGLNSACLLAASGLFLGAAVSLRVFYYYPAYAFVLAAAWACFRHRRLSASALVAFVLLAAFPALCQYACTYRNTGAWSLLDPQQTAYYVGSEMSLTSYGLGAVNRDPVIGMDVVGNDQLHWYTCADCMRIQGGWVPALLHGDFKGVAKVAWMRNEFYFGTYVSQPAIAASTDRISSPWIALANWLAVLSAAALFFRAKERWIPGVPLVFWMVSWSLAILIHPENRFAILILVLAWTLGPLAWMAEPYPPAERG